MAPPDLRIPQVELDADRAMAREAAISRGESRMQKEDFDHFDGADNDEDINGYQNTSIGAKTAKKKVLMNGEARTANEMMQC